MAASQPRRPNWPPAPGRMSSLPGLPPSKAVPRPIAAMSRRCGPAPRKERRSADGAPSHQNTVPRLDRLRNVSGADGLQEVDLDRPRDRRHRHVIDAVLKGVLEVAPDLVQHQEHEADEPGAE